MIDGSSLLTSDFALSTDVLIVGAGPVGMTLALALADSPLRVCLIDRRPRGAWSGDPRALALSYGSRQLLDRLKAWNASAGTGIRTIHVSQRGGFGRTLIDAGEYGTPALGYVMRYRDLAATLDARIPPEQVLECCTVDTIEVRSEAASITLMHAGTTRHIDAKLIVHAEGNPTDDPGVQIREYGQHAIIAEVRPATAHNNRAWERFTADGPLALLPIGPDYAVVFTVPSEKAGRLLGLDDEEFLAALRLQFGSRLDFVITGARASYPLALRIRQRITQQRQVWIGNCAQTLHPVSGQGFNLGLRDAWQLAEILLKNGVDRDLKEVPRWDSSLENYAASRRLDRQGSAFFLSLIHISEPTRPY